MKKSERCDACEGTPVVGPSREYPDLSYCAECLRVEAEEMAEPELDEEEEAELDLWDEADQLCHEQMDREAERNFGHAE